MKLRQPSFPGASTANRSPRLRRTVSKSQFAELGKRGKLEATGAGGRKEREQRIKAK